jgi:excisionase family DNA binding protein
MSSQPAVRVDSKPKQATPEMTVVSDTHSSGDSANGRSSMNRLEVVPSRERETLQVRDHPTNDARGHENLLTVSQVAQRLGMSKQWVRDHIDRRRPKIDVVRWGSAVRFRPSDVDRFIIQHVNAPRLRRRRA